MSKLLDKFPMGATAKDVVTGFVGIISSKTEWFTGCDQIGLRPAELDKEGKPKEAQFFDVTRIKIIEPPSAEVAKVVAGKVQTVSKKATTKKGGPQDRPRMSRG